jgi:hypothetical protein
VEIKRLRLMALKIGKEAERNKKDIQQLTRKLKGLA